MADPRENPRITSESLKREFQRLRGAVSEYPSLQPIVDRIPDDVPEPGRRDATQEQSTPDDQPTNLAAPPRAVKRELVPAGAGEAETEIVYPRVLELHDFDRSTHLAPRPMRLEDKKQALDARQQIFYNRAVELNAQLKDGRIEPAEWMRRMMGQTKDLHTTAYTIGYSGRWDEISQRDWGAVGAVVQRQYRFLRRWRSQIEQEGLDSFSLAELNDRAQKYGAASSESFEKGYSAEVGMPPNVLPAYPGDGTTECMCITSPTSRVLTKRGWVPLYNVQVGDKVWTHKRRWRPVTAVNVKPSKPNHRKAYVRAPTGQWVGATGNHKWHTSEGWKSVNDIDKECSNPYLMRAMDSHLPKHASNAKALHELRNAIRQSGENRPLHGVPSNLSSVRSGERPPRRLMQVLRLLQEGKETVGRGSREDDERAQRSGQRTPPTLRGYFGGHQLERTAGWTPLHLLLGGQREALHLPVTMEVGAGARRDSGRVRSPSCQRRPVGRPAGEPRMHPGRCPSPDARSRKGRGTTSTQRSERMCGMREGVLGTGTEGAPRKILLDGVLPRRNGRNPKTRGMRSLRGGVYGDPVGQVQQHPEILFEGMLPGSTAVFDLEVAGDHSFCIEGLFAHNTRCKCRWAINILSKENQDFDCTWTLGVAEHCASCLERASSWVQLEVRNGVLVSDPEPIFAR